MKDYQENRISREDLLSLLSSTLQNIKRLQIEQSRKITEFGSVVYGKQFTVYRDARFLDKKKELVDMDNVLFFEIINHGGRDSYIFDHIQTYKNYYKQISDKYEYYNALINTTFHISFNEFNTLSSIANETLTYNVEELGKMLVMRFCNTFIEMRTYCNYCS